MDKDYCVYAHYFDKKLRWIGEGKLNRPSFPFRSSKDHTKLCLDATKNNEKFWEVLVHGLTKEQSLDIEQQLIIFFKDKKDLFNVMSRKLARETQTNLKTRDQKIDEIAIHIRNVGKCLLNHKSILPHVSFNKDSFDNMGDIEQDLEDRGINVESRYGHSSMNTHGILIHKSVIWASDSRQN